MRKRWFAVLVVMGLLFTGLVVPAVWADSHGEILDIQWQWAQLTETEPAAQSVVPDPENYVLVLTADGNAALKADCNQVLWTYTAEGNSLTFNTLGPSTLAFCGEESSDQLFMSKLGVGGTWSVEDGRLVLELNENAGTMVFDNGGARRAGSNCGAGAGNKEAIPGWASGDRFADTRDDTISR
jgi:heat shock protein HslJ